MAILFRQDFAQLVEERPKETSDRVEPTYAEADLEAARTAAWEQGYSAGSLDSDRSHNVAVRQALESISSSVQQARVEAAAVARHAADEIAALIMSSLTAILPSLCSRY